MKTELKIGDYVFCDSRYHGLSIDRVERLTKTQAVLESGTKLRLPFKGHDRAIGDNGYGVPYYRNYTEELKSAHEKQNLTRKLNSLIQAGAIAKLSTESIEQLIKILAP